MTEREHVLYRALGELLMFVDAELDPNFDGPWSDYFTDPRAKAEADKLQALLVGER